MPTNNLTCNAPSAIAEIRLGAQSVKCLFQAVSRFANEVALLMESVEGCLACVNSFQEEEAEEGDNPSSLF